MIKIGKKHLLLSMLLFSLLLIVTFSTLTPYVNAANSVIDPRQVLNASYTGVIPQQEATFNFTLSQSQQSSPTPIEQKGLTILNGIVGIDLTKYAVTPREYLNDSYFGVASVQNVGYMLQSNQSRFRALLTFANGNLMIIDVLDSEGSQSMVTPATSVLETAQNFLSKYQNYMGNPFYGSLSSMLGPEDVAANVTKASGNLKLEVDNTQTTATFRWTYTFNGVEAPDKCVVLSYTNGSLQYFIDRWSIHNVGSTSINLSEQDAITIAMQAAQHYSWNVSLGNDTWLTVQNFNVTKPVFANLLFDPSQIADQARSPDPLTVYPLWHVGIGLDKFYPGNVNEINVYIWADTKQVCHIQEQFSTMDAPADEVATGNASSFGTIINQAPTAVTNSNSLSVMWIALPALATAAMIVAAPIFLAKKKNSQPYSLPKLRSLRSVALLCCVLMAFMLLSAPVSAVYADPMNRRFVVWGSESTGDTSGPGGATGRKTQTEIQQQRITAQDIAYYFGQYGGYVASDYQGSNSLKYEILGNISYNEQHYPGGVAVVDFDHGVGSQIYYQDYNYFHYMFEDNVGVDSNGYTYDWYWGTHMVYDSDIYQQTTGKTFFALINTCESANTTFWSKNGVGPDADPYPKTDQGVDVNGYAVSMPYAWTHLNITDYPIRLLQLAT